MRRSFVPAPRPVMQAPRPVVQAPRRFVQAPRQQPRISYVGGPSYGGCQGPLRTSGFPMTISKVF